MGNKNYRKYSENYNNNVNPEIQNTQPEINNNPEITNVNPEIQNNPEPNETTKVGIVTGCTKLNVRKEASKDSEVLCIIDRDEEVEILESANIVSINNLVDLFVKIRTASGIEGYCVEDYIKIK